MTKKTQTAIIKELSFLTKAPQNVKYMSGTHFTIIDATALFTKGTASPIRKHKHDYIKIIDINNRPIN